LQPSSASLLTSIIAYWNFDETSGSRVDSSGNGNTLTVTSSVGYTTGKIGNTAVYDETMYNGVLVNPNKIIPNTNCSLQCWIYPTADPSGEKQIIGDYYRNAFSIQYKNGFGVVAIISVDWTAGMGNPYVSSQVPLNAWSHIVATNDVTNKKLNLYLNGMLVSSKPYTGTPGTNLQSGGFAIGSTYDNAAGQFAKYEFCGYIDEVWKKNFGFLYGVGGKSLFIIFMAILAFGIDEPKVKAMAISTGVIVLFGGVVQGIIYWKWPEYFDKKEKFVPH
jgi:hypothetical protein